jgi:hypothetical protein
VGNRFHVGLLLIVVVLGRMENTQQLEAAKSLLQTVQDIFPKQRRAAAAHEYKIAIIAWHRQCRSPEALPGTLILTCNHALTEVSSV